MIEALMPTIHMRHSFNMHSNVEYTPKKKPHTIKVNVVSESRAPTVRLTFGIALSKRLRGDMSVRHGVRKEDIHETNEFLLKKQSVY